MINDEQNFQVTIKSDVTFEKHLYRNVLLLFVLDGSLQIDFMKESAILNREDFIIVNSNRYFTVRDRETCMLAVVEINYAMLCRLAGRRVLLFRCNSTAEGSSKYDRFRYLIRELLSEYAFDYTHMTFLKISAFYRLCHYMIDYFALTEKGIISIGYDTKTERLLQFFDENYDHKITLNDAAEYMYMTPTSFSRFFHRTMGVKYIDFLNQYRLDHAVEKLLYSNESITEIALGCGFSNLSNFNKVFKKSFGVSPREYKAEKKDRQNVEKREDYGAYLERYQKRKHMTVIREQQIREIHVVADASRSVEMKNPWKGMIHLGSAPNLFSAECQRQILMLKKELGFQYGCVTAVLSDAMQLRKGHDVESINFSQIDSVLDFLVKNNILPVVTLDNQQLSVIKSETETIEGIYAKNFESQEECIALLEKLIDHCIYRYGEKEVEGWMFDLWYNEFVDETLGVKESYVNVWNEVYNCIRSKLPKVKIGGCGLGPSLGYERMRNFYQEWKNTAYLPDFISVHFFPYHESERRDIIEMNRQKMETFFTEDLNVFQTVMMECGFSQIPVYILQWNLSFVQRNYFNDTSAKAAIMLRQMTANMEKKDNIEHISYWAASDLNAVDYDSGNLLNGACGLVSKDGIPKPAFYAMRYISSLADNLLGKGDHYIVTSDRSGHIQILLFNSKEMNYSYYSRPESEITLENVDQMYVDDDAIEITLTLNHLRNKKYYVRKQVIGPGSGDVLSEWRHLGTEIPLTVADIQYLEQRCIPYRENAEVVVNNQTLVLMERLMAHEIMSISIL